jgi:hypothetical protein
LTTQTRGLSHRYPIDRSQSKKPLPFNKTLTFLTDPFDDSNNNISRLITMPSVDVMESVPATSTKESVKSVGVLEELIKSLSISKTQDETNAATGNIASLLNGPTEEQNLPTK